MQPRRKIYWLDQTRFDLKPNKSPLVEVSNVLTELGYEVCILTGYGRSRYWPVHRKVRIRYFFSPNLPGVFRLSLLFFQLFWLVRNSKPRDIIILSPDAFPIVAFLWLFRRRNIHLDVRTLPVELDYFKKRVASAFYWKLGMKLLLRFAKGYSFITQTLKKEVEKEFGIHIVNSVAWSSGVDPQKFRSARTYAIAANNDKFILFYHGTLSPNRGIDRVIKALCELEVSYRDHILFVIVGTGPGHERLVDLVIRRRLADRVQFRGLVPYEEIPDEIAKAHCCICPLPARREWNVSSPIKIFEYMASGKPIILTPIPAHTEVAAGQDFIVWTSDDGVPAFCRAIQYAYDHRASLMAAASKAVGLAERKYDWKILGRGFGEYLRRTFT